MLINGFWYKKIYDIDQLVFPYGTSKSSYEYFKKIVDFRIILY